MPCKLFPGISAASCVYKQSVFISAQCLSCKRDSARFLRSFRMTACVLPASIHELMLLPKQMISLANVRTLLRKANQEATKPEEWLSDQVYLYERSSDKVRLAEMEN